MALRRHLMLTRIMLAPARLARRPPHEQALLKRARMRNCQSWHSY